MTSFYFASINSKDKEPLLGFSGGQGICLPWLRDSTTGWRRRARRPAVARRPAWSREFGGDARGGWQLCGGPAGRGLTGTARGRPPGTCEASVDANPAWSWACGRLADTGNARGSARGQRGRAGRRESGAAARECGPRSRICRLCKKLDRYFYFSCKCCEPLDVLRRWMKGRKLRCDLLQLRYWISVPLGYRTSARVASIENAYLTGQMPRTHN
jgi:hypothetical protein